jgi:hypothetical protein
MLTVMSTDPGISERQPGDGWLTLEVTASATMAARSGSGGSGARAVGRFANGFAPACVKRNRARGR